MHLLCPHCKNAIELVRLDPVAEITCTACGSTFHLDQGSTTGFQEVAGSTVGRFTLIETVGHGAFGTVYRARDPELDRTVAVKVPRRGNVGDAPADMDRFLREARSAAQLRHPAIVAVHEVGVRDGSPYLVSDFVEGVTLANLLTGRRPSPREAAGLVADVADALHHAHAHGVVHRDVKPSNIMVRPDGSPVVMDFGLAKRDAGEITMTMDGQVLGTPAYMSPEQARGEGHRVDGRSDVYSVGVILYQLLTGELPFRGNSRMLLHQVLHDEPKPPRALNDRLPRDLETIALKAMAKEPARRYSTAKALADDLRAFLAGRPIAARPVGRLARAWRLARRNPVPTALSAGLMLALAGGLAGMTVLWRHADRERQDAETAREETRQSAAKAEANFQKARDAVDEMLTRVSEVRLAGVPQAEKVRRDLLEAALRFYQGFLRERADDPGLREETALAHSRVGEIHALLDQHGPAEQALREAARLFGELAAEHPDVDNYRHRRVAALGNLGNVYRHTGRLDLAAQTYGDVLAEQRAVVDKRPNDLAANRNLAATYQNLASLYRLIREPARSEAMHREGIKIAEHLVAAHPDDPDLRTLVGDHHNNLGTLYDDLGRLPESEAAYRTALEIRRAVAAKAPTPRNRARVAGTAKNLAAFYQDHGQPERATEYAREAIAVYERLVADHPDVPAYRFELAGAYSNLGLILHVPGRLHEEEELMRKAVALIEPLVRDNPTVLEYAAQLGCFEGNLGQCLRDQKKGAEAVAVYGKAVARLEEVLKVEPRHGEARGFLGSALAGRARTLSRLDRHAEALPDWDRAIELAGGGRRRALQLDRSASLIATGDHAGAADQAAAAVADPATPAGDIYNAACMVALAVPAAAKDTKLETAERERRAGQYAVRAVALLRRAAERGFNDVGHVRKDSDLDALRDRADFKALLAAWPGKK